MFKLSTIIRFSILLIVTIIIFEFTLQFFSPFILPSEIKKVTSLGQVSQKPGERLGGDEFMEFEIKKQLTMVDFEPKVPHPYFGFVYNRYLNPVFNRDGFYDDIDFSRINKNQDKYYYIGIFGGSVAKEFAYIQKRKMKEKEFSLADRLKKELPNYFGDKEIILLNFGVSAYKQPQQFFVSSFFSNKIHAAITIDGYNEIANPFDFVFPANYPVFSNLFYSLDPARNIYIAKLYGQIISRIKLANLLKDSFFSKSRLVGHFWLLCDRWLKHKIDYTHSEYRLNVDKSSSYYSKVDWFSQEQQKLILSSIWERYTRKQHDFLSNEKINHFHFIQPNQYVKNSKPLSNREIKSFYDKSRENWVNEGYESLFKKAEKLRKDGYRVFNLTKIYSKTIETVYKDSCCHFNKYGNDIMEEKISLEIIKYLKNKSNN